MFIPITYDTSKSIEQLENDYWKDLEKYPTGLVENCHLYRKKPVGNLTIEELRLLISQNIGLPYLMPLALNILTENPFAEGDLYQGDLLSSVLSSDTNYWKTNGIYANSLIQFIDKAKEEKALFSDRRLKDTFEKFKLNNLE
jgi:hypothetical protein